MDAAVRIANFFFFFFQAEDGIRDKLVTGVQTCALPISRAAGRRVGRDPHGRARARPRALHHVSGRELRSVRPGVPGGRAGPRDGRGRTPGAARSEEHTSELQSLAYLVCRLLLEKKKKNN